MYGLTFHYSTTLSSANNSVWAFQSIHFNRFQKGGSQFNGIFSSSAGYGQVPFQQGGFGWLVKKSWQVFLLFEILWSWVGFWDTYGCWHSVYILNPSPHLYTYLFAAKCLVKWPSPKVCYKAKSARLFMARSTTASREYRTLNRL